MEMLFRCYEIESCVWTFKDKELTDPEFPEYIKMIQVSNPDRYVITQYTGVLDIHGERIYANDIVTYKDKMYRVIFMAPGFLLECADGEPEIEIPIDQVEKLGNCWDDAHLLTQGNGFEPNISS